MTVLGAAFSVTPWLRCSSDNKHIREGFWQAGGALASPQGLPNEYDIIIYYKRPLVHTRKDIIAINLYNFNRLQVFTNLAQIAAYKILSES